MRPGWYRAWQNSLKSLQACEAIGLHTAGWYQCPAAALPASGPETAAGIEAADAEGQAGEELQADAGPSGEAEGEVADAAPSAADRLSAAVYTDPGGHAEQHGQGHPWRTAADGEAGREPIGLHSWPFG
jgi:hypothetical protein